MPDPDAVPVWAPGVTYTVSDHVMYGGVEYVVLADHTSTESWTPDVASTLYEPVA